jgi:hypothetical protein
MDEALMLESNAQELIEEEAEEVEEGASYDPTEDLYYANEQIAEEWNDKAKGLREEADKIIEESIADSSNLNAAQSTAEFMGSAFVGDTRDGNVVVVEMPPKKDDAITVTEYTKQNYEERPWHAEKVEILNSGTGEVYYVNGKPVKRD